MEKENKELVKQRVTITPELKVSVLTGYGVIEDGAERVLIKGDFVIDARSVALLTTALAGKAVREMWFSDSGYVIIAPADAVSTLSEELKKQKKSLSMLDKDFFDKIQRDIVEELSLVLEVSLEEARKTFEKALI